MKFTNDQNRVLKPLTQPSVIWGRRQQTDDQNTKGRGDHRSSGSMDKNTGTRTNLTTVATKLCCIKGVHFTKVIQSLLEIISLRADLRWILFSSTKGKPKALL